MNRLLFMAFMMAAPALCAQETISVSGTVTDAATGNPLPFAQLTVRHTTLGTSANNDGVFQLNMPAGHAEDTLLFGYMGYEPQQVAVASLLKGDRKIPLRPAAIELAEIEVVGLTPQEVIRRATAAIPENMGADSILLTAFVRVQKIVGSRLAEYTEAIVKDLKDGYYAYPKKDLKKKHARSNFPMLVKGRVRSDTLLVKSLGEAGQEAFCLYCPFVLDIAEMHYSSALDEGMFDKYTYRMQEVTGPDGLKRYVITYDQKEKLNETLYQGEIRIRADGFRIESILYKPSMKAFDAFERTKYNRPYTIRGTPGWIMEMPMGQNVATYGDRNGTWTLSAVRNDYAMLFIHPESGEKVRYQYKMDLVVTETTRDTMEIRRFRGDKTLGAGQRWDQLVGPADERFWQEYNFLPVEEALRKSLKEMGRR